MAAGLLILAGYERIAPQQPLGGPDGGKDILLQRQGNTWVAACYFPHEDQKPGDVEAKYRGDLGKALKLMPYGFVFVTNQRLTVQQREQLAQVAREAKAVGEFMDREACRAYLDSPKGYGLRLEHLQIEMNKEEQLAFVQAIGNEFLTTVQANTGRLDGLAKRLESYIDVRTKAIEDIQFQLSRGLLILSLVLTQLQKAAREEHDARPMLTRFVNSVKSSFEVMLAPYREYVSGDATLDDEQKRRRLDMASTLEVNLKAAKDFFGDDRPDPFEQCMASLVEESAKKFRAGKVDAETVKTEIHETISRMMFQQSEYAMRVNALVAVIAQADQLIDKMIQDKSGKASPGPAQE